MIQQNALDTYSRPGRTFFKQYGMWITLSIFMLAADKELTEDFAYDESKGKHKESIGDSVQEYQVDALSVEELLSWGRWGNGYFGNFRGQAVQMTEDPHSEGIMLISPDSYGVEFKLSCDVMTLRPATVLVAMLSVSDGDGTGDLHVPPDFNGAMSG